MPLTRCRLPAISLLHTTNMTCITILFLTWNLGQFRPTREGLVGAASDGKEVLDDMLAIGGLSTPTLSQ